MLRGGFIKAALSKPLACCLESSLVLTSLPMATTMIKLWVRGSHFFFFFDEKKVSLNPDSNRQVCLTLALFGLMFLADAKPVTVIRGDKFWSDNFMALLYLVLNHAGTPYLFHTYDYPVDPNRGAQLSPSFQAANGVLGANLVAYFGTGNL